MEPDHSGFHVLYVLGKENGKWVVFEKGVRAPIALFDNQRDACDYSNEIAKTMADSILVIHSKSSDLQRDQAIAAGSS
jgi:hypothetical protein